MRSRETTLSVAFLSGWILTGAPALAEVLQVPGDALTIQAGLDLAMPGDTVELVNAFYSGIGSAPLNFGGKDIILRSASGNPDNCVIDGLDSSRLMIFTGGETSAARVEGIEFRNGAALEGGAMLFSQASSPVFENCRWVGNSALENGGVLASFAASPSFIDCAFLSNSTSLQAGAAVWTQNSTLTFQDCLFKDNTANGNGGAIRSNAGVLELVRCRFEDNAAGFATANNGKNGGAMDVVGGSVTALNCVFQGNSARSGGGMYLSGAAGLLINCLFNGNRAEGSFGNPVSPDPEGAGGAIFIQFESFLTLINPTIHANFGRCGAGGVNVEETCELTIRNGVLWDNERGTEVVFEICNCIELPKTDACDPGAVLPTNLNGEGDFDVAYSVVNEVVPGDGNQTTDPLFVDPLGLDATAGTADDDLRVKVGSPAIDSGDNTLVVDEDVTEDLAGNPRRSDDTATDDTGLGTAPIVDRGAYEFDVCVADIDGDGVIGFDDLLRILSKFNMPCVCPDDLNGDGIVDFNDLTVLLSLWGACV